jgi:glycosyltransferase involved in cell wall biosynthesis
LRPESDKATIRSRQHENQNGAEFLLPIENPLIERPFFSICVPQYNRTSFLMEACKVLQRQSCKDFELCISDDCSPDGRGAELQECLRDLKLPFIYRPQERNVRYDANLRNAILLASGQYCLLMGNDDCLAGETALQNLRDIILRQKNSTGVVITNYAEYDGSRVYRRATRSGIAGSGLQVAISRFRDFSFVSGLILRRDRAQAHSTRHWDGSEMYQMYLACRILAEGYGLLELEDVIVRKNIAIPGEEVDSYATKPRSHPYPIREHEIPLIDMGRLVYDAVQPKTSTQTVLIFLQILVFTYPFWIFEYRRVQSWPYAAGICLGMRPRNLLRQVKLSFIHKALLQSVYLLVTAAGLLFPSAVFRRYQEPLHAFAKSILRRKPRTS